MGHRRRHRLRKYPFGAGLSRRVSNPRMLSAFWGEKKTALPKETKSFKAFVGCQTEPESRYSSRALPLVEKELLERIRRRVAPRPGVRRGMGDDCAVIRLPRGHEALVTTDFSLEGVHFRREWHAPDSVGHRCLARGLSDVAAMGGEPVACFLSLGVPEALSQQWVNEFLRGFLQLARRFKVPLAGGDTSSSKKITADIVVVGKVPSGTALLRSGARPGDHIYVTGDLGYSAAVLKRLYAKKRVSGH